MVPNVIEVTDTSEILFVSTTRLATEIVARTAVTVIYEPGESCPSTKSIQTTSLEEIEEVMRGARKGGNPDARTWTNEETQEAVTQSGNVQMQQLLAFAKEHGDPGPIVPSGKRLSPSFGFYVAGKLPTGESTRLMIFKCNLGTEYIRIYLNFAERFTDDATARVLRERLKATFGSAFDDTQTEPRLRVADLIGDIEDFERIFLWFKEQALKSASTR